MMSWWSRPALHFLLLGGLLYAGSAWQAQRDSYRINAPGPERLQAVLDEWVRSSGRLPTERERQQLLAAETDGDILLTEALRRQLHRDDPVVQQRLLRDARFLGIEGSEREQLAAVLALEVHKRDEVIRRRLIQRMEDYGRSRADATEPDEPALRALYQQQRERWQLPARLQLSHIYLSADKPLPRQRAEQLLQTLRAEPVDLATAPQLGDVFLHGNRLPLQDSNALAFYFGEAFVETLLAQGEALLANPARGWLGPVESAYGYHLVLIEQFEEAGYQPFAEVQSALQAQWRRQSQQRALADYMAELRECYEVLP